jgi:hypothetical protein
MGKVRDLTGQRFGKLTVIEPVGKDKYTNVIWRCKCDCGNYHDTVSRSLINGSCKSCGCLNHGEFRGKAIERHGCSKERLYRVWTDVLNRCYDKNKGCYKSYGGRGIAVCEEWRNSYMAFREWAYATGYDPAKPGKECSLERIDVDGNYCPENCKWITVQEQAWNKRDTVWLDYRGERITLLDASRIGGICQSTIRNRIRTGWSVERAIEQPARRFKNGNASRTR